MKTTAINFRALNSREREQYYLELFQDFSRPDTDADFEKYGTLSQLDDELGQDELIGFINLLVAYGSQVSALLSIIQLKYSDHGKDQLFLKFKDLTGWPRHSQPNFMAELFAMREYSRDNLLAHIDSLTLSPLKPKDSSKLSVANLPNIVIARILSYLPLGKRIEVRRVNRTFKDIVDAMMPTIAIQDEMALARNMHYRNQCEQFMTVPDVVTSAQARVYFWHRGKQARDADDEVEKFRGAKTLSKRGTWLRLLAVMLLNYFHTPESPSSVGLLAQSIVILCLLAPILRQVWLESSLMSEAGAVRLGRKASKEITVTVESDPRRFQELKTLFFSEINKEDKRDEPRVFMVDIPTSSNEDFLSRPPRAR